MKNKRIFKDFQASKMSLNIYTSPLLAFVFVFIGEFVAFTLYGIGLLALIGLARNFGEAGQNLATYLQTLHQSLTDKTSDFRLILGLLAFGFILNTVFRWTRKVEKRPIRTLGFYRENFLSNLLKGFSLGLALFLLTLLGLVVLGQYRLESIHLNPYSLESLFSCLCRLYYPILDFTGDSRRSGGPCLATSSIGLKNQSKTSYSYI
ncbi:caax amino protease family protein [Streptococcus pneumoniae]|nr:caax amino protease family protein [Streptococcus pneumoniae]